jgi:hypothetical protein
MSRKRDKAEVQIVREMPQAMGSAVAAEKPVVGQIKGLPGRNSGPHLIAPIIPDIHFMFQYSPRGRSRQLTKPPNIGRGAFAFLHGMS